MPVVLYVWKGNYPWDVRAEKVCKSLIKAGHEVYMLARWAEGQAERESIDGINVIRVGYKTARKLTQPLSINPIWAGAIKKAILELKPAIIIPREIMLAEACGRLGRRYNIPVVMDMAEHYPAAMKGWKKYYKSLSLRILVHHLNIPEIVEQRAVRLMSGIITVSRELSDRLGKVHHFNTGDIQIVNNTPEKQWFDGVDKGPKLPPLRFAYHGHFSQDRNLDTMIKAFIIAAEKCSGIRLTLAGDGENFDECFEIAEQSAVKDRICFTGAYKHGDIRKLYGETDIAILPFKTNEFINHIIANKLFDYMAAGKPVIVSRAKPMARIIEETGAGIVADCSSPESLADVIININDYPLREMSENGIAAFRDKYNWDVDADNLIKFVNRLI